MTRTPEKLVEVYLEWRKATFPEWSRSKNIEIEGITTLDPATRKFRAEEGQRLVKDLLSVQKKGKAEDIDIDIKLCIDDGKSAISSLESLDLSVREVIDLVAPDADEKPWIENARWIEASQQMPRALARAQASGPWIKDLLTTISEELKEAQASRDPLRSQAAQKARVACEHLANAVGYRPRARQNADIPAGTWNKALSMLERDRKRFEVALNNAAPDLLPESAMMRLTEEISDRGRLLGIAESWKETLKNAVIKTGWAVVPEHVEPVFEVMSKSRAYTSASLRNSSSNIPTVIVALPTSSATIPTMVAHETYPGHLLQKVYQMRASTEAMRLLGSSLSSEGWAHYAEMKIKDLGVADPGTLEVGVAQRSLLRSARLLARTGSANGKMEFAEAVKLFRDVVLLNPDDAKREAMRVQWDDKAADYSLGRIALEQMENEFVGRGMGDAVAFRSKVLPIMSAPLEMIARRLGLKKPDVL